MFRLFILIFLCTSNGWAKTSVNCSSRNWAELEAKFCIGSPAAGDSESLIVYFHGIGGNERQWFEEPRMQELQKEMIAKGLDPWVVTVSFGEAWLLTEVEGSYELLTKTVDELLPDIQKQIRPQGFNKKILIGASMGGYNTSQVLLKRTKYFDRYMMICPAITSLGPFSTQKEINEYIKRTKAQRKYVQFMVELGLLEFPTLSDWKKHSPLDLAERTDSLPKIYISCGMKDEFGFQEGAEQLFKKIKYKAQSSWWVPIQNGRHCSFDKQSIIQFAVEK